eukprot:TRINITY_DN4665_c0_g1_i1.p1 TRINITY_DN4665_c0_g1~~TRINITY_DN4665_c0_g1_i1.p1  ORF type:complete len:432 (-),score=100.65 TRINITY_DN4665_c0_g1_i1:30-1325(-)
MADLSFEADFPSSPTIELNTDVETPFVSSTPEDIDDDLQILKNAMFEEDSSSSEEKTPQNVPIQKYSGKPKLSRSSPRKKSATRQYRTLNIVGLEDINKSPKKRNQKPIRSSRPRKMKQSSIESYYTSFDTFGAHKTQNIISSKPVGTDIRINERTSRKPRVKRLRKLSERAKESNKESSYSEENQNEYEFDDFVVPDDQPISQYDSLGDRTFESSPLSTPGEYMENIKMGKITLRDAFSQYIQLLASCAIDPEFEENLFDEKMDNDIQRFVISQRKVQDKLDGIKRGCVMSSVWSKQFNQDLLSLPNYKSVEILVGATGTCEVCHKDNKSLVHIKLYGKPYNSEAFLSGKLKENPVEDTEVEEKEYHIGLHCQARTETFHSLHHFKYKLFQTISKYVKQLDYKKLSVSEAIEIVCDYKIENDVSFVYTVC